MTIHLTHIHVYPVKGLGGLTLAESAVTRRGLQYDRRFLVIDNNDTAVTQRDYPRMATVWMEVENGNVTFAAPDLEPLVLPAEPPELPSRMVRIWSNDVLAHEVSAEANAWLSEYLGFDAKLVYMPDSSERKCDPQYVKNNGIVSFADGYPLLVI